MAGILLSGMPGSWTIAGMIPIVLSLAVSLHGKLRPTPIIQSVELGRNGELHILGTGGEAREANLLAGSRVFGRIVVLRMRVEGRLVVRVIPADAASPTDHRRLRTWLRWRARLDRSPANPDSLAGN